MISAKYNISIFGRSFDAQDFIWTLFYFRVKSIRQNLKYSAAAIWAQIGKWNGNFTCGLRYDFIVQVAKFTEYGSDHHLLLTFQLRPRVVA